MAKKLAVYFNDRPYVRSHMRTPRGRGSWAFTTDQTGDQMFWSPSLTYGDAKRWVTAQVRELCPADAPCDSVHVSVQP